MPIYRMLQGAALDDEAVKAMTTAFEDALGELSLTDRTDPLTEIIAKRIIECGSARRA
jgi:23S rRNA maturation mini-RNase III